MCATAVSPEINNSRISDLLRTAFFAAGHRANQKLLVYQKSNFNVAAASKAPNSSSFLSGTFESFDCSYAPPSPSSRCLSPLPDVERVLVVVGIVVVRYVEVVDVVVVVVIIVVVIVQVTERDVDEDSIGSFMHCACIVFVLFCPVGRFLTGNKISRLPCPNIHLLSPPTCWHC